jgi:Sec-independent protein translocase protein TatA
MGEITVIVLLALIFIGPKKLPELASGLGKLIREIRKTTSDVKNEIQLDEAIRKPFEELREAVTLHPEELKRRDRIRQELEAARRAAVEAEKLIAEAAALAAVPGEGATVPSGEGGAVEGPSGGEAPVASGVPASPGAGAAAGGGTTLPTPGVTPPVGTVPREPASQLASSSSSLPSSLKRPLTSPTSLAGPGASRAKAPAEPARTLFSGSETSRREATRGAGAHQPPVDSAADRSNTTQALTEADLAAVVGTPPPPPPSSVRTGRTYPPPPPRLPGATPGPALRPTSGKSAPIAAVPAPASVNGSRSGAVSGPVPADGAKSAPLASAPAPSGGEEASEKKPAPST